VRDAVTLEETGLALHLSPALRTVIDERSSGVGVVVEMPDSLSRLRAVLR